MHIEARSAKASREKLEEAARAFESGVTEAGEAFSEAASAIESNLRLALDPLVRERDRLREEARRAGDFIAAARAGRRALGPGGGP